MSPAGKEVAGKGPSGGREAPSCQHRKIRPVVQVSGPRTCLDTEPICPSRGRTRGDGGDLRVLLRVRIRFSIRVTDCG